jgi:hypothetical protein
VIDAAKRVPPSRYSPTGKPGSTIAEAGLNFRVRNGNGCGPCSMNGGKNPAQPIAPLRIGSSTAEYRSGSAIDAPCASVRVVKPHGRLVPVSSTHCCASTSGLSTS